MGLYEVLLSFFVYAFLGWCTEVAFAAVKTGKFVNRGFLNGPLCPIYGVGVVLVVLLLAPIHQSLALLYVASTVLVTVLEGLTGFFMDKIFHHKWWDYTDQPLNIGGYVCLPFSLVWGVCCVLIVRVIHPVVERGISALPMPLGIVFIVILEIALFADLGVTASSILKLNRQLDAMEKIAAELREFSDRVGANIYENVTDVMEFHEKAQEALEEATEEGRRRLEEAAEESRRRMEEHAQKLRDRYEELARSSTRRSARFLKAFPTMRFGRHIDILEELRERIHARR